jgi:hypothetical protein
MTNSAKIEDAQNPTRQASTDDRPSTSGATPLAEVRAILAPASRATNSDLEKFFGVREETRSVILRNLGLPKRRAYPWTEIWNALGLEPEQPEALWESLMLGPKRDNTLWSAAQVAEHLGITPDTINSWYRSGKSGFPRPLVDIGPKTRKWLPVEIRAYDQPSIYAQVANQILRKPPSKRAASHKTAVIPQGSLIPLPPSLKTDKA